MNIDQVRNIAKQRNIKSNHLSKSDLIRTIQSEEGNFNCFATAHNGECDQVNCIWREDCFDAAEHQGEQS